MKCQVYGFVFFRRGICRAPSFDFHQREGQLCESREPWPLMYKIRPSFPPQPATRSFPAKIRRKVHFEGPTLVLYISLQRAECNLAEKIKSDWTQSKIKSTRALPDVKSL